MAKKKQEELVAVPQPVAGRVVILPAKREDVSEGGIVLPASATDAPQTGNVVAVDAQRTAEETHVKLGDIVLYSPYAQTFKVNGTEFVIMPEKDILAIL
jgi:chaperonin GroES